MKSIRLCGLKFRRQHAIPPYIVDFYCAPLKLVIELDGSQHNEDVDRVRTGFLQTKGIRILRFWDNDVLQQTHAVVEAILDAVRNPTLTPTSLPMGEGLKTVPTPNSTPLPVGVRPKSLVHVDQ